MPRITMPLPPGPARAPGRALGEPRAWMLRGACRGADTGLFFPIATPGRALQQVSSAKAVRVRCIVRPSCLSYALATMQHGIWGGTTGDERMAMSALRAGPR
jgi:WhiB family redox-sensing transcriptional regulator